MRRLRNSTKHAQRPIRRGLHQRHLGVDHRPILELCLGRIHQEACLKMSLSISAICMQWHSTEWRAGILHVSHVQTKNKQFNPLTCDARGLLIFKDLSVPGRLCTQRADDPLSSLRVCTVIILRVLCVDSWPDTQPGQFYGSFRLLGLIRMRQVVLSRWLRLWHPALIPCYHSQSDLVRGQWRTSRYSWPVNVMAC